MTNIPTWQLLTLHNTEYLALNILAFISLLFFAYRGTLKYSFNNFSRLFFLAFLCIIFVVGARFFYTMFYTDLDWSKLFEPTPYGFSLFGGLIGAVIYLLIVGWSKNIPLGGWLDINIPGLIGYVTISKIGCFLNGCCFGTPTLMPWGIPYAEGSQAYNYYIVHALNDLQFQSWQVYSDLIHPVQLYESFLTLLLLIIALSLLKRRLMPGIVFLLVFGAYSLIRLGLFYFRAMPYDTHFYYLLAWIYTIIAVISFGILLMKLLRIKNELLLNRRVNQCN